MGTGAAHLLDRVGVLTPKALLIDALGPGEVGFITAAIKEIADARVGDTITDDRKPADGALPGFRPSPAGRVLRHVPDRRRRVRATCATAWASCGSTTPASSTSPRAARRLGLGFRCGFLGLLHLEIIQERLEREFDLDLVITAPSVVYRVHQTDGEVLELHNPADYPDPTRIDHVEEPWIKATILVPGRVPGRDPAALHREARHAAGADLCRQPGHGGLPPAAQRGGLRLLRPAEVDQPRLCQLRLPCSTATARATWSSSTS